MYKITLSHLGFLRDTAEAAPLALGVAIVLSNFINSDVIPNVASMPYIRVVPYWNELPEEEVAKASRLEMLKVGLDARNSPPISLAKFFPERGPLYPVAPMCYLC